MRLSSLLAFPRTVSSRLSCRLLLRALALVAFSCVFILSVDAANNPVPFADIVSPAGITPGSTGLTLKVQGSGFVPASTIAWNGTALKTTFVSSRQLTAGLPDAFVVAPGIASVMVVSPAPGGGNSGAILVPVAGPAASVSFLSTVTFAVNAGTQPQGLLAADFNADGKLDLASANKASNNVSILLSNGDGTFTAKSTIPAGPGANWLAAGDFNGDGKLDLAVANSGSTGAGGITILLGNGDGTFTLKSSVNTGSGPSSVVAGDFNGDGHLDLAVSNQNEGTVTILQGAGDGTFLAAGTVMVGSDPQAMVAGDFNEDGNLDLAVANRNDGTVSVLLGIGDGSFQTQSIFSTGGSGQPTALLAADFNADGHLDVAAVNASDAAILLGDGNGHFSLKASPGSGTSDLGAGLAGDFNGDGKLDIVVSDRAAGKAFLFRGVGDGTFTAAQSITTAVGATGLAAGDFNGDGGLDLAVANGSANNISVFLQSLPVSLNPTSLAFGNARIGVTTSPHTITLTNNSGSAMNFSSIGFASTNSAEFSQNNTCGSSLSNNAACTITSAFTPQALGPRSATLTIIDSAANSPRILAASGSGTSAPSITSVNNATFDVRVPGSFTVTTTGFPAPSLSAVGNLPAGLTFTDNGDGTATLGGTSMSGTDEVDILTITAQNGAGPDAAQLFTLTVASPPLMTMAFGAATILPNGVTSLRFSIENTNIGVTVTGIALTDSLPAGLVVSTPNNLSATCSGSVIALAGSSIVSLSGAILAPGASCALSVNVTGTTGGIKDNRVQVTSSNEGPGNTSIAIVTVIAPASISIAFNPTSVVLNASSTLSFTISNPNAGSALSGVGIIDNLPAGMVVAATPNLTGSCGSGLISAASGSGAISLSGGTLAASPAVGSSCSFSVDVAGISAGNKSNITGNVMAAETGAGPTSNTAILAVIAPPSLAQAFTPVSIALNSTTSLTFTLTNPFANTAALAGVAFTDTLPAGLTVANSSASPCGGTFTATAPGNLALTGATLAANGQCAFSVTVTGAVSGNFINSTTDVTSTNGGTGNAALANLTVAGPPAITKSFGSAGVALNSAVALTFSIANSNASATLNGIAFTDSLPAGLEVTTPSGMSNTCGGVVTAVAGSSSVGLAAGALAAGATCLVSLNVTGTTVGVKNNSVQVASSDGGIGNTSSASITVALPPVISKTFGAASIFLSSSTSLTFTIQNNNAATTLTGIAFSDTLPAGLLIATPSGQSGTCGGGALTAAQGTSVIHLSGAMLGPNTSCSLAVNVIGAMAGNQNNITGNVTSANGGTGGTATASINVIAPPSLAEAFSPSSLALDSTTTLTFTLTNPPGNAADLSGVAFADTLPAGLVVADSSAAICGGTVTTIAPTGIALNGADIAIAGQCTFSVTVTGAASGTYSNTTGPVTSVDGGTGGMATATVTVATPPSISKAFGAASIGLAGSTSLRFTITNPNAAIALSGVAFTDPLPAGLVVSTPNGLSGACGNGGISAAPGSSSISLTAGTIATGGACTFSVNVTATSAGPLLNTTGIVSASNGGSGSSATASLNVLYPDLIVAKSHTGNFFQGQAGVTYVLTSSNIGAGPTAGAVTVTDALPTGLSATAISGTGWTCTLGTLTCARNDPLAAGASYPAILVTVDVALNAAFSVINHAAVSGGGELNTANNTAEDATTITLPPDFTLSVTSTVTITAGQQGDYAVTVAPLNNTFVNPITFTASGLPARAAVVFNPSSVTLGATAATSTLVLSTTGGDAFVAGNAAVGRGPLYAMLLPFAGLLFCSPAFAKSRSKKRWLVMVLLVACGGIGLYGCSGVAGNFQHLSTPPGTYVVTITAQSGAMQHSAQVTLIVQP